MFVDVDEDVFGFEYVIVYVYCVWVFELGMILKDGCVVEVVYLLFDVVV